MTSPASLEVLGCETCDISGCARQPGMFESEFEVMFLWETGPTTLFNDKRVKCAK